MMELLDYHDLMWSEIPVEKNPAYNFATLFSDGKVTRKKKAIIIHKWNDNFMVSLVPLLGSVEHLGLFFVIDNAYTFCTSYIKKCDPI